MKAIVLVGGLGTRLRPLTEVVPKPLLPVLDRTILEHTVGHLAALGVDEVVLSMGYQPDAFRRAFPDDRCCGVPLRYAVEPEPLDTGGGIAFAARYADVDSTFVAVNVDVLHRFQLAPLLATHRRVRAEGTVAMAEVDDPSDLGVLVADGDGRVTQWVEKPGRAASPANTVNAGTYILEPSVLHRIPEGTRLNINSDTFPLLVADGSLYAERVEGWWLDVGTVDRYLQAHADMLAFDDVLCAAEQVSPGVWVAGQATVDGQVLPRSFIAAGACVSAGATVAGSSIGRGALVSKGATVTSSIVLENAVVGEGATIEGAVVGGRAQVPAGMRIGPGRVVGYDEVASA